VRRVRRRALPGQVRALLLRQRPVPAVLLRRVLAAPARLAAPPRAPAAGQAELAGAPALAAPARRPLRAHPPAAPTSGRGHGQHFARRPVQRAAAPAAPCRHRPTPAAPGVVFWPVLGD